MRHLKYVLLLLIFQSFGSLAQSEAFSPKGSWSIDVGIPTLNENYAFRRVMTGLFNGGVSYQYNVLNGFTLGAGAKFSFFTINPSTTSADWKGGLYIPAVHAKVGYEKFTTERVALSAWCKAGYAPMIAAHDSCKAKIGGPFVEGAFFVEPQVEVCLLTGKGSSDGFSFVLGYNFYFSEFRPDYFCLDGITNLSGPDYEGITRFLSIGFGYRYYMGRN
ncbi:MAG: hypothetical protein MI810_16455 [Flavobacteriales bacterium]|nr:hypothetical protein [Flavobacteriales bacterium]